MIQLTSAPAFGFETTTCNAGGHYKKSFESNKLNINKYHKWKEALQKQGFEGERLEQKIVETAWKVANIGKILGYIPFIGTLVGFCRICIALNQEELPNTFNHIVRGSIEILSLGFLLFIPDLILTGYRAYQARSSEVPSSAIPFGPAAGELPTADVV